MNTVFISTITGSVIYTTKSTINLNDEDVVFINDKQFIVINKEFDVRGSEETIFYYVK